MDLSGAALEETELGGVTDKTSGGFCLVANIKNDNNKNATSHIAVMSMVVLLRGTLSLGICCVFDDSIQKESNVLQYLFILRSKRLGQSES